MIGVVQSKISDRCYMQTDTFLLVLSDHKMLISFIDDRCALY
jgi:hypothetical protein